MVSIPIAVADRVEQPPQLEGPLENAWQQCRAFDQFSARGIEITQSTEALLGYDDDALYFAFVMHEDDIGHLKTDTTKRTRDIGVRPWINEDDSIQVLIDPKRDGVNYVHFLVNPVGKWMTSAGAAPPEKIECDYNWSPADWTFKATVEETCWTVRMCIPACDLGLDRLEQGQLLGINFIRERAPDPHETSFLRGDTMSWTTQWTSHVVYEPGEFAALALGKVVEEPEAFEVPQWQGPPRPRAHENVALLLPAAGDAAADRELPELVGSNFWCIHYPVEAFKGLERSRLAHFSDGFGWRVHRGIDRDLDIAIPEGREWTWWFYGFDQDKLGGEAWIHGIGEEKLGRSVFIIHGRRHTSGQCLPPFQQDLPIARKGFEQLARKFGDRFIGFPMDEWDSDVWSVATGMREDPIWDNYPDQTPAATGNREEEHNTLRREWDLFKKLSYDWVTPLNCWRCIDHYALEWGARCAFVEISENGNPSKLTQLAFARGAARQYGKFFMTYQATMMSTGYTSYEQGAQYDANAETVWATGPDFGPSVEFYRRLLFTSYLAGTTVQVFEHPQVVHVMPADEEGTYKLSPHGEVFADLLDYDDRYGNRGVPYQPVALLLDYLHGFSPPYQTCEAVGRSGMQTWFSVPYERADHQVYQTFRTVFPWCRQRIERNGYILANTFFGDIFDVLLANPPSGALSQECLDGYRVALLVGTIRLTDELKSRLVDYVNHGGTLIVNALHAADLPGELIGGEPLFESGGVQVTARDVGSGRVIATPDCDLLDDDNKALPVLGEILATVAREVSPVEVKGDVQYHFLKTTRGWLVALMNNKGIVHHSRRAPEYRPEEKTVVELVYDGTVTKSIERLSGDEIAWQARDRRQMTRLSIAPGGIKIVELV